MTLAEVLRLAKQYARLNRKVAVRASGRRVQIVKGIIPWPGRPAARARHHAGSGRRP